MRAAISKLPRPVTMASASSEALQPAERPTLHRAAWVVPVASPPLQDGAVLAKNGHILAVGPYRDMKAASPSPTMEVDHGSSAILPGLVNAHTHLELSGLSGNIELPQDGFAQWLTALFALRPLLTQEFLEAGLARGQQELLAGGCCLCGDITNGACLKPAHESGNRNLPTGVKEQCLEDSAPAPSPLSTRHPSPIIRDPSPFTPHASHLTPHTPLTRQAFLEVLGFDRQHLADVLDGESAVHLRLSPGSGVPPSLAAHACYSTAGTVIREAKEFCRAQGRCFSIHVAEHLEEMEFLAHGTGFCREILEALDRWNPRWLPPGTSPVRYLERLRVLDAKTLLVHAVYLTDDDWEVVVRNHCPVCFCPRSNRHLEAGRADLGKALRHGLTAALGTDSLASNTDLNLFAEAAYVLDQYPDVLPGAVVFMATLGGARSLGHEQRFGSIEPGKRADLLAVSVPASLSARELHETIIHQGNKGAWQWLHHPVNGCDWAKSVI